MRNFFFIIFITLSLIHLVYFDSTIRSRQDCSRLLLKDVQVFITISSLLKLSKQREIELNWHNIQPLENDLIVLFGENPEKPNTNFLDSASPADHPKGFYTTSIEFPRTTFGVDNLTRMCIGYWVEYIRDDVILASNCLRIEPQWMWDSRSIIGNFSLPELMIPGTHNAGSYCYQGYPFGSLVGHYQECQDESVWTQLVFGVRHFDLRIGLYQKHELWVVHNVRMVKLKTVIDDVKKFVESTQEIVILDLHRFPIGFKKHIHHDLLINYLMEELGVWMIPRYFGYYIKLFDLWKLNKRIMVFYAHEHYIRYDNLWPGLQHVWANAMDSEVLKNYFEYFMSLPTPPMWSAMAQLTPKLLTEITNPTGGMRVLADLVNRDVTLWFRDLWWYKANIVATDYFLGNDIIQVSIYSNKLRSQC